MKDTDVLKPESLDDALQALCSTQYELEASCWAVMQRKLLDDATQEKGRKRIGFLFCYQMVDNLVSLLDKEPPVTPSSLELIREFRQRLIDGISSIRTQNIQSESEFDSLYEAFLSLASLNKGIWQP